MEEIIKLLQKFSFSKMEGAVYITLLQNPHINGSQIAKILNVPRSTAYSCLEGLYRRGAVMLVSAESNLYQANDPDQLLDSLKKEYIETAEKIKEDLAEFKVSKPTNRYYNIQGYSNVISKIKELFNDAEKEIYLNTDFDLKLLSKEIKDAHKRGVRIILFTFKKIDSSLPIECYYNSALFERFIKENTEDTEFAKYYTESMLMVVDFKKVLIASGASDQEHSATFSENPILVSTVSEHIHHDIYLLKLKKKYQKDFIESDILIGTLQEKKFDEHIERITHKTRSTDYK